MMILKYLSLSQNVTASKIVFLVFTFLLKIYEIIRQKFNSAK